MLSITQKALEAFDNQHDFERMSADVLQLLEYQDIVLIAPRGGSDDGKDITFTTKNGEKGLACVTLRKDSDTKFNQDFFQRKNGDYKKYIFFTNRYLSAAQKKKYTKYCKNILKAEFLPFDSESLRSLLDSPSGYSLRQNYLHIPMSSEELIAMQEIWRKNLLEISSKNPSLNTIADQLFRTQSNLADIVAAHYDSNFQIKYARNLLDKPILPITSDITISLLQFLHKAILYNDKPTVWSGKLRTAQTWIGKTNNSITKAIYVPPPPEDVPILLNKLLTKWNRGYSSVNKSSKDEKIKEISNFHIDFLSIHPFLDANGRVARLIMEQQISDLLRIEKNIIFKEKFKYFEALQKGQQGNKDILFKILKKEFL